MGVLSEPTSAQTRPPAETTERTQQEPDPGSIPSTASVERIRRALASDPLAGARASMGLDFRDQTPIVDRRPAIRLFNDLDFIGGVDLLGGTDSGPVPMGGPTHRAMMSLVTPREVVEAGSSDVLGIATASALAVVPYAIQTIVGWLFGHDDECTPNHPILTESEERVALAGATADGQVMTAGLQQRGRTVALLLVVPADTSPDTARALGERFVLLVKTLAVEEPDPDDEVGAGNFDYIVRVNSPTEIVIALGGKATSNTRVSWSAKQQTDAPLPGSTCAMLSH